MLNHTSSDVRVAACDTFSCIGNHVKSISDQLLKECIPALLPLVKDKNTAVKASAEQALIDILQLQESQAIYHVRNSIFILFVTEKFPEFYNVNIAYCFSCSLYNNYSIIDRFMVVQQISQKSFAL